jgi:SAM-dependent methyltransferase
MDSKYYQEYFFLERNHWWFRVRASIIDDHLAKMILKNEILRILNIGVATGATTKMLNKYGQVTSTEYDQEVSIMTSKKLGISIINCSILNLPFADELFDLVCAFDVIEHVDDDLEAIREMRRVCKSGGTICITVPAFMILWSHHDVVNNHFRRYKSRDLKRIFEADNHGNVIHTTYFNTMLFPLILIFRLFSRLLPDSLIRHGAGSDFTILSNDSPINRILFGIFSMERLMLKKFTFNLGTSILFSWRKSI